MFSGNNTVEYPTQWALNPGAYQNVSNEQVDWAALAQQWIQMKESCPPAAAGSSSAQPSSQPSQPPQTSRPSQPSPALVPVSVGEEGGEAPMEVEGNESDIPPAPIVSPQQWKSASDSASWGNSWEQWGNSSRPDWGWQSNSSSKNSQLPGDAPCVSTYSANDSNYSGYSSGNQPNYRTGYWSTDDTVDTSAGNVPLSDNLDGSRGTRRTFRQPLHTTAPEVDTTQTIDAAKRRQLPAWIREGLEKMEREKQKQVEREKEKKDREEFLKHKKLEEDQTPQTKSDDSVPKMPTKSKFDTDSDNSDNEDKNTKSKKDPSRDRVVAPPPPIIRSKEEIMQDIMLCVRRSLTEILLEVTNEQILSVCQEELSRKRSQPQATHGASMASKSQALSSIGGQLGLGIYENSSGDSNSENESEDGRRSSTPGEKRRKAADITDGQLQESIKRRKAEFEKTTREIETQIALDEMGNNKNDHKASSTGDRSSKGARGMGDSESDGEDSTTHIRNEQNNIKQKKNLEGTPPLDPIKKSLTDASADKFNTRATKSKHSEGGNKSLDSNHKDRSSSKFDKYSSKRDKNDKYRKRRGNKNDFRDESSARSTDSDSESDSSTKKSDYSGGKRSPTTSDSSSNSSSNSSYSSDSSVRNSKKRVKKKESSDESNRSKRSKKDKTKSKDKKDKRNKHLKRSVKSSHISNPKPDNSESQTKKQSIDYKEDYSSRDSSARKSYTRTPERKSYKSRYSERSRSRSDDRRSHHTHESHDRYYGSSARDKYKVKDRRDRSRDDRERLRDDKDWHRDDRGRSRDRKERRDRDKRSDREYRNSRSNRY